MADNESTRTLYSDDCLNVLNDELALPTGSVDLIYLDPPFNSKSVYNLPFAGKDKDTRPVEAFVDTWTWGAKEDTLLASLSEGPQSRHLADIVTLAQAIERGQHGGGSIALPPTCLTWPFVSYPCGGYSNRQVQSTYTVTRPPRTTSSW